MRRFSPLLSLVLIAGLLLTVTYMLSAQDGPDRNQRPDRGNRQSNRGNQQSNRGNQQFDPAQMIERMTERAIESMKLPEEEAEILKPFVHTLVQTRMEQSQQQREAVQALRAAVDANNTAEITSKLAALKVMRKDHQAKSEALEQNLLELLTVEQEAQLTVSGIVNSDGMGMMGGGFRGRQQGAGQRPGGQAPRGNQ